MKSYSVSWIFILLFLKRIDTSKILLLVHMQRSHTAEATKIGKTLLQRGHDIYTIFPESTEQVNAVREKGIKVLTFPSHPDEIYMDSDTYNDDLSHELFDGTLFPGLYMPATITKLHCEKILGNESIIQTVRQLKFDLAIVDAFLLNYCHYILPHNLGIPTVSTSSATIPYWIMGIPALPSFVNIELLPVGGDKLSFWRRIQNTMFHFLTSSLLISDTDLLIKYAPDVGKWNELIRETQLYIVFRDAILERPWPAMPNTIFLPGLSYEPTQPLTEKIQNVFDLSTKGVFLMSFGTSVSYLPADTMNKFLDVYSHFPDYQILWAFPLKKNKNVDDIVIPSNVHVFDWLPQNDILGHPKTKLFITHCGNNGQYEAVYHSVPMIGFPIFGDQLHNAFRMVDHGYGLHLDIVSFTVPEFHQAIVEILLNDTYQQTIGKASSIIKDRRHPIEEAADWIEHVLTFGGKHLRGFSMDMPWYQLILFDIGMFLLFLLSFMICLVFLMLNFIKTFIQSRGNNSKK